MQPSGKADSARKRGWDRKQIISPKEAKRKRLLFMNCDFTGLIRRAIISPVLPVLWPDWGKCKIGDDEDVCYGGIFSNAVTFDHD